MAFIASANSIAKSIVKQQKKRPQYSQNPNSRMGTVLASFNPTEANTKTVPVILDGEDAAISVQAGIHAFANDRVGLNRRGNTWAIEANYTTPKLVIAKTKVASTSRSTQTVSVDPDLSITLHPGSWLVECDLVYTASVAGQIQTSWVSPADVVSPVRQTMGAGSSATNVRGSGGVSRWGSHNSTTLIQYAGDAGGFVDLREWMWVSTVTGGIVAINWSRVTSDATATILQLGSTLRATRIS